MNHEEESDYFHERARKSSFEARGRSMNLSAAGIAGLFALLTTPKSTPSPLDQAVLLGAGILWASSIGAGVLNSWADAQWSYYRADRLYKEFRVESVENGEDSLGTAKAKESWWHGWKEWSERATQILFAAGVIAAAVLFARFALNP